MTGGSSDLYTGVPSSPTQTKHYRDMVARRYDPDSNRTDFGAVSPVATCSRQTRPQAFRSSGSNSQRHKHADPTLRDSQNCPTVFQEFQGPTRVTSRGVPPGARCFQCRSWLPYLWHWHTARAIATLPKATYIQADRATRKWDHKVSESEDMGQWAVGTHTVGSVQWVRWLGWVGSTRTSMRFAHARCPAGQGTLVN